MKARRLPSGKWNIRVKIGTKDGKTVYRSITGETKAEVIRLAMQEESAEGADLTVSEACEGFLKARGRELSPSTLRGYEGTFRAYIDPDRLGCVRLSKITSPMLQEWVGRMDLSQKSKKNHYGFLLTVLRYYGVEKAFRVRIAPTEPKEMYTPTIDEVNRVLSFCDEETRIAVALACFGLRRGEVCALTAEDLDRRKNTVRISKAYAKSPSGEFVLKAPKTKKSIRLVPVTPAVMALLPTSGPVVSCSPDCITNRFARAVREAGVPHFRFHDLRSFFASIALSSAVGVGSRTVQDLGGWQTDRVMKSHYDRSISDVRKKDEENIIAFFSRNLSVNS